MDDITAEYEVQELVNPVELTTRVEVSVGAKTDMGRIRDNNEDKHEFYIPDDEAELASRGMVFVVCDGMGGHEAGQHASELSVKSFIKVYRDHPAEQAEAAGRAATESANRFVLDVARAIPSRRGMGTTLTGLLLVQDQGIFVHVGDSRLYRLRGGELEQLTTDHTWVEETVKLGLMTREEAEVHPHRNVITRSIGTADTVQVDSDSWQLEEGDVYFICSDGINGHVSDEVMAERLAGTSPSQAAWDLVNLALDGGGSDNATAIVVRIDKISSIEPSGS
jgi:protein phosphatase